MLRKLKCAALALAASAMLSPAQAGTDVTIKPNGFSPIGITVLSEDGKSWTKVKSKQLLLDVTIGLGKTDEVVLGYKVRQGWLPQDSTVPWLYAKHFSPAVARVDKNLTVSGSTDNLTPVERTKILKGCNAKLNAGGSIQETHSFFYGVEMQLLGEFSSSAPGINVGALGGTFGVGTATVRVTCKGALTGHGDFAAEEPKTLKVTSLELFRSTFANATSQPNPGTVCKKARLLVRLKTNKAGAVKFRLWTKVGDKPMTSKVVDAWSNFSGPGQFKAEYKEWVSVNKTSYVQAMAEDLTNPIGQSSGWKDITLHCSGPGGGGLADQPKPDNDGGVVQLKVSGNLTLADQAGAPKDKPRLGQAVFKIWSNKPGPTSYRLTCSGGRNWEGTLQTAKVGNHKYRAVGAENFQISKTEQIGCALRSTSKDGDPLLALATKLFKLVKVNPDLGGGNTITGKPNPTHGKPSTLPPVVVTPKPPKRPAVPGIMVAPLPKIVCIDGKVASKRCFCPAKTVSKRIGRNKYRCVKVVVQPKRVVPKAPGKRSRLAPALRRATARVR